LTVSFGLGAGTGGGTFSAVTDKDNGTYTAIFTATNAGSTTLTATIGGQPVTGAAPLMIQSAPASTASISGTVFLDLNASGTLNASDPRLAGRTVYLAPSGGSQFAPGDLSATTNAAGAFTLTGVAAGSYSLGVLTFPGDTVTGPAGGFHVLTVTAGASLAGENIGLQLGSSVLTLAASPTSFGTGNARLNTALINGLYQFVLGRVESATEVTGWLDALAGGESYAHVVAAFLSSPEHEAREAAQFYLSFLGRPGSTPAVAGWVNALEGGMTAEAVAQEFLDGPEYSDLHVTNTAFVEALYNDVLGRQGVAAEVDGWVNDLNAGATRAVVAADFIHSTEAYERAIASDYVAGLGRQAEPGGLAGWLSLLQVGAISLEGLAAGILDSSEFRDRADQTVPSTAANDLSGTIFKDVNHSGQEEPGDPGLAGRTVFADLTGAGKLQGGDPTATTSASGNYLLQGVASGTVTVRLVSEPGDSLTDPASGAYTVDVLAGSDVTDLNFGLA
jgi:hypothetical protein